MPAAGYYGGPPKHPLCVTYGQFAVDSKLVEAEDGVDPGPRQHLPPCTLASGQEQDRNAGGVRAPRDLARRLSVRGLLVDPALTRDHEIGAVELRVEAGRLHDQRRALHEGRAEEGDQAVTGAAGRPGPWLLADVDAEVPPDDAGKVREGGVQLLDRPWVGALLRAGDLACASRSGERVVDIACDAQRERPWDEAATFDT